ncbi:lytic transglycosylase domain-containing protein [Haloechinothrix salitolerans]|uniref:Lytic transglycosylase domain-containing protein n=1 Tax=Haloechinothrix salitolerans TaxID=926830 RepID=A0ABW2C7V6_9PSEU
MSLVSTSLGLMLLAAATAYPMTANSAAPADIPADYLAEYRQAASTCGPLDWALLAGVGKVETDHGRSPLPGVHSGANSAGARGPMQFLPATFADVRGHHPEVGPNVYNPRHAIPAAAHYLCDSGLAHGNTRRALWAYNHSTAYADDVLDHAARYRNAG